MHEIKKKNAHFSFLITSYISSFFLLLQIPSKQLKLNVHVNLNLPTYNSIEILFTKLYNNKCKRYIRRKNTNKLIKQHLSNNFFAQNLLELSSPSSVKQFSSIVTKMDGQPKQEYERTYFAERSI